MATLITKSFLKNIAQQGRILEGLAILDALNPEERAALPSLSKLSSWECILEEVLDTDHDPDYYARFAKELLERGYSREDIAEMRLVAWETAGWFNYEMMAWDWCQLSESDMHTGLEHRFKAGNIDRAEYERLNERIAYFQRGPNQSAEQD